MVFLQPDLTPSTAPVSAPVAHMRAVAAHPRREHSRLIGRLFAGLLAAALLAILGVAAARATESLAVGILAADLVFLMAVAGWSAVVGDARR